MHACQALVLVLDSDDFDCDMVAKVEKGCRNLFECCTSFGPGGLDIRREAFPSLWSVAGLGFKGRERGKKRGLPDLEPTTSFATPTDGDMTPLGSSDGAEHLARGEAVWLTFATLNCGRRPRSYAAEARTSRRYASRLAVARALPDVLALTRRCLAVPPNQLDGPFVPVCRLRELFRLVDIAVCLDLDDRANRVLGCAFDASEFDSTNGPPRLQRAWTRRAILEGARLAEALLESHAGDPAARRAARAEDVVVDLARVVALGGAVPVAARAAALNALTHYAAAAPDAAVDAATTMTRALPRDGRDPLHLARDGMLERSDGVVHLAEHDTFVVKIATVIVGDDGTPDEGLANTLSNLMFGTVDTTKLDTAIFVVGLLSGPELTGKLYDDHAAVWDLFLADEASISLVQEGERIVQGGGNRFDLASSWEAFAARGGLDALFFLLACPNSKTREAISLEPARGRRRTPGSRAASRSAGRLIRIGRAGARPGE